MGEKPKLAAETLEAFWQPLIDAKAEHVPGLDDLRGEQSFPSVCVLLTSLLYRSRDPTPATLRCLLAGLLRHCDTETIVRLAKDVLHERVADLSFLSQLYWTAVAFLAEPTENVQTLIQLVENDKDRTRELYIFLNSAWEPGAHRPDCRVLEPLIALLGGAHENVPESWKSGWVDETDAEHLARFVRRLIDRLRYDPDVDVGKSFERLLANSRLAAWHDHLKHAFAAYARARREALFRYADVEHVIDALAHQAPANAADLQAIVVDHLRDLARYYRDGATDGWKAFWNTDKHGNATDPKIENQCRDRLLEHLKPKLAQHAVTVDREGSFAEDKRSDIKITAGGGVVLPVEIKRHYHPDLWTALAGQLRRLYTRDPETGGRGIYLVFWFGEENGRRVPTPPQGVSRPRSAAELEERLRETIPAADRSLTEVIVIDCAKSASRAASADFNLHGGREGSRTEKKMWQMKAELSLPRADIGRLQIAVVTAAEMG